MSEFYTHCERLGISSNKALNLLLDQGLISDHCVQPSDIAKADLINANEWLSIQTRFKIQEQPA